jgi:tetratricopeptide (TPR) repeat protein
MAHLSEGEIRAFAAGQIDPVSWQRIVRHLLTGCSFCKSALGAYVPLAFSEEVPPASPDSFEESYDGAIDRALVAAKHSEKTWSEQRERAAELLPLLRKSPQQGLRRLLGSKHEFPFGWPVVEGLLQLSFEERFRDPKRMVALASQACSVANATPDEDYPPGFVADMRARAWAELANAYRVQEQYNRSEEALAKAYEEQKEGTEDLSLLASILSIEASLRRAQRRIPETLSLLSQASRLYLDLGERHLAGRTLVSKGLAFYTARAPMRAVQCLEEGLTLLSRERDPQLLTTAYQSLLVSLVECREYRRAGELLLESGLRQAFAAEPLNLLRLRWVEGQIHAGLGRLAKAENAFREVRKGFQDHDLEYVAALVGLDLAAVWLREGKEREVHALASQMLTTFELVGVQEEAFKAMRLLQTSCEKRTVTLQIVEGVRAFLDRLQNEPRLTFEESLVI